MSYSRPQNFSFYGFDPQNVYTTKRHFLARNDAFLALIGPDLTHSAMCGLGKVNQRKKRRQWKTGHSTRPPTSPDRSQSIMACGLQRVVLYIKFFFKNRFSCGWSKIVLFHYYGHLLIQQLVLPHKP